MIQIARENRELLIRINKINKTKGMIDSYNPNAYSIASHWKNHENEMRLIEAHNRDLYRRLRKAVSTVCKVLNNTDLFCLLKKSDYNCKDLEKEWQHTVEKLKHSCKYPLVVLQSKPSIDTVLKSGPSISSLKGPIGPHY